MRQKLKEDKRKWKEITPLEIPTHISKPDLKIIDKKKEEEEEEAKELYNKEIEMEEEIEDDNEEEMEEEEDQELVNENENETEEENIEQEEDTELDDFLNKAVENLTNEEDQRKLTETNGSMTQELKKHKRSPNQENSTDKRKKIITPDDYNHTVDIMVEEVETEILSTNLERTPSLQKLFNKVPKNINIQKVNTNQTNERGQTNQS